MSAVRILVLALPLLVSAQAPSTQPGASELPGIQPQAVDLTNDGKLDLLMIDETGHLDIRVQVAPREYEIQAPRVEACGAVALLVHDLNRDGCQDLYVVSELENIALLGDGCGAFRTETDRLGLADPGRGRSAAFLDVDGDGLKDLLLRNEAADVVFWADSSGIFSREELVSSLPGAQTFAPVPGDPGEAYGRTGSAAAEDPAAGSGLPPERSGVSVVGTGESPSGQRTRGVARFTPRRTVPAGGEALSVGNSADAGAAQNILRGPFLRTVALWSDLEHLSGAALDSSVFVEEAGRSGDVVFYEDSSPDLPPWASGPDLPGLSQSCGTGRWIHQWSGPVDFSRLGTVADGDSSDEAGALQQLIDAGFDEVYFPPGTYDGFFDLTLERPLKMLGAGPGETVFVASSNSSNVSAFTLRSSLTLEGLEFDVGSNVRLVFIETVAPDMGTLRLKLRNVAYGMDAGGTNAVIESSSGPQPLVDGDIETRVRLELDDCYFKIPSAVMHVSVRAGLRGYVNRCVFDGGRQGIFNIPAHNVTGLAENDLSPDFRVTDCEFVNFDFPGAADKDSYHIQAAGKRWVISGCKFRPLMATTRAGHIYSRLQDSHIVGCSFEGGGTYHLFFKGAARIYAPDSTGARGWGNTVLGCTFEETRSPGGDAQIFLNVKEQRIIGCTFRNYENPAIWANKEGPNSDNLFIQSCWFSSDRSPNAIRLSNGGRNIRILDCTFAGIRGTGGPLARPAIISTDVFPGDNSCSKSYDDMVVRDCSFMDNVPPVVRFYGTGTPYDVNRFRFAGNSISTTPDYVDPCPEYGALPPGEGFLGGGNGVTVTDVVLEGNYLDVGDNAWNMPAGCIARSVDNTWIDNPGSYRPTVEALGIAGGTLSVDHTVTAMDPTIEVSRHTRIVRVSGELPGENLATLDGGAFDAQDVTLLGLSSSNRVKIDDGGNVALHLGTNRVLGENDTLGLLWREDDQIWVELGFSDN